MPVQRQVEAVAFLPLPLGEGRGEGGVRSGIQLTLSVIPDPIGDPVSLLFSFTVVAAPSLLVGRDMPYGAFLPLAKVGEGLP